jgi:pilus assembly protein CpaF
MADSTRQPEIDFGPLKGLVQDEDVREIMVNGPHQVYVEERKGKLRKTEVTFRDSQHIIEVINSLLAFINPDVQVSPDYPHADARFPDGTRMQAFIPPITISGPSLTIRKAAAGPTVTLKKLSEDWRTLNEDMADFLKACVKARLNIMVAGSVGSGKTTLLNALTLTIPAEERIVTVEEEAEFRLSQEHVVALESRPPNWEGKGEISVKDLLRMVPRARPDRILIGDLTGPEVLEALRLMDKGYDGTMITISANSPQEALERMEMMVKMSDPNLPVSYLRSLIGSAVDLVVQINRLEDGSRKVVRVTEILPVRGGDYDLHDVFLFLEEGRDKQGRVKGSFQARPVSTRLRRRMEVLGINLPPELVAVAEEEEG